MEDRAEGGRNNGKSSFCTTAFRLWRRRQGNSEGINGKEPIFSRGIRYARANRFQPPEEVEPWEGVKEAASYGFVCPMLTRDHPQGELLVPHRYWPQDEDCLSLNIWSQSLDRSAKNR